MLILLPNLNKSRNQGMGLVSVRMQTASFLEFGVLDTPLNGDLISLDFESKFLST